MPLTVFQPDLRSLTSQFVARFTNVLIRPAGSGRDDVRKYQEMVRRDPVTRFSMELVFLYVYSQMGEYTHPRRRIERDIRESIAKSKGAWPLRLKEILTALWYGYSWTEISSEVEANGRYRLKALRTLDPTRYSFRGTELGIDEVEYSGTRSIVRLDYNTGIHLVFGSEISFNEYYGCGRLEAAYPYWEMHQILLPVLAIATQRQATPILVKKTETGEDVEMIDQETGGRVLDAAGNPVIIKKGFDAIRQLSELGSAGITAIDPDDDIYSIDQRPAGDFLIEVMRVCEQYRMQACLVPPTVFAMSTSGVGDSGLSERHLEVFEMLNEGISYYLGEELVEQLFRPYIQYNFNEQDNFGYFPVERSNKNALETAKIINDAIRYGTFSKRDLEAVNQLRMNLAIPELSQVELDELVPDSQVVAESGAVRSAQSAGQVQVEVDEDADEEEEAED